MKKLLYLLALCAMTMVSCESLFADEEPQKPVDNPQTPEEPEEPGDGPTEEPEQPKIEFQLTSDNTMEFSAKGGECIITYAITNPDETLSVKVTNEAQWIVESDALNVPSNEIHLYVEANQSVNPRSAIVTLSYGEFTAHVAIIQYADQELLPHLSGIYYGDSYSGAYNYHIALSTKEAVFDIVTGGDNITEGDRYLILDLYSTKTSPEYNVAFSIPEGEYILDADNTTEANTIGAKFSYFYDATAEGEPVYFTSGAVNISKNRIDAEMVGTDGKEYYFYALTSSIDNRDLFTGKECLCELSTLADHLEIPFESASIYAECNSDYYVVGKNMWLLYVDDYITGHSVVMELLTPVGESPVGLFEVSSDLSYERMALPGFADGEGTEWWSWYYCYDKEDNVVGKAPIISGYIEIVDNGDGTHTATFEFEEDKGLTISGSCTAYFESYGDVSVLSAQRRIVRPSRK